MWVAPRSPSTCYAGELTAVAGAGACLWDPGFEGRLAVGVAIWGQRHPWLQEEWRSGLDFRNANQPLHYSNLSHLLLWLTRRALKCELFRIKVTHVLL